MRFDIHINLSGLSDLFGLGARIFGKLETMETKMAALEDAVTAVQTAISDNEPKLAALATAISDGTSANQAKLNALAAQIADLQAQVAAGGDVAGAVTALAAAADEARTEGQKIDDATTALATALNPPSPTP